MHELAITQNILDIALDQAEEATLAFKLIPVELKCRQCVSTFNPGHLIWTCPNCQSQQVEIVAGRETFLESLEVE